MKKFIGLDIGTLSTKGVLVTLDGTILAQKIIQHDVVYPKTGWAEQDAENTWWAETVRILRDLLTQAPEVADEIDGIGISGLFPALLIADEDGKIIRPAMLYSDCRAYTELRHLNRHFHLAFNSDSITPKLLWIKTNEPENFQRIKYIFSSHNYIVFRLTGAYCVDFKVAVSFGHLVDKDTLEWNKEILLWLGIDKANLPQLRSPIEIVGLITKEASSITGLPVGIPVICGSGDSLLTLIGSGVINKGDAVLSLGTSGWLGVLPYDLELYFHNPLLTSNGAPYLLDAYVFSLGSTLSWIRDKFEFSEKSMAKPNGSTIFQLIDDAAKNIPAGSEGVCVIPNFQGYQLFGEKEHTSGIIYGLTLSHNPLHVYRGLLESYGYIVRSAIDNINKDGITLHRSVFTGNGARSTLWRQIITDITDKTWLYYGNLDASMGSAFLVGYALGCYSSLNKIHDLLPNPVIHSPNVKLHKIYDKAYKRFSTLCSSFSL
jgi:xylulokinase